MGQPDVVEVVAVGQLARKNRVIGSRRTLKTTSHPVNATGAR